MRRFKAGESVKVKYKPSPNQERWHTGTYIKREVQREQGRDSVIRDHVLHVVRVHGQNLPFTEDAVKSYKPIDPDQVQSHGVAHATTIGGMVAAGMGRLLREDQVGSVTVEEQGVVHVGGAYDVYIEPAAVEVETFQGTVEHPGWSVTVPHVIHNYPHEPDGVECVSVGQSRSATEAAALAVRTLWMAHEETYWENVLVDQGYEEVKEEIEDATPNRLSLQ